jgi:uncharacterized membrane protein
MLYFFIMPYHEKHSRSIAKAISYRIISICVDLTVVFVITHRIDLTIGIVTTTNIVSTIVYYLHERAWNKSHFGRKVIPDKEIG